MKKTFNYQSDANFYDKKDFIIAVLKRKINSFKEYDAKRKKHYAGLEQKIGELESYIDELENGLSIDSLNNKIQSLENKIEKQKLKIKELQATYSERIFSRFVGEYTMLRIVGDDIRTKIDKYVKKYVEKCRKNLGTFLYFILHLY